MRRWAPPFVALAAIVVAMIMAPAAQASVPRLRHVWVFVLENHKYSEIIGNPHAPYMNRLARRHALATRYFSVSHPSLPNYLAMISGSTQGCASDSCKGPYAGPTLARQLSRHGLRWCGFFEGLPSRGYTGGNTGTYIRHHNPFVYFSSVTKKRRQRRSIRRFAAFPRSLSDPPALSYVVPNNAHNMHTGSIGAADRWLHYWVRKVIHSPGFRHRGAVFITWDEAEKGDTSGCCLPGIHGGHTPLIAVIHGGRAHARLTVPRTGYSLLRTIEAGFRLPHLGLAARVRPLGRLW